MQEYLARASCKAEYKHEIIREALGRAYGFHIFAFPPLEEDDAEYSTWDQIFDQVFEVRNALKIAERASTAAPPATNGQEAGDGGDAIGPPTKGNPVEDSARESLGGPYYPAKWFQQTHEISSELLRDGYRTGRIGRQERRPGVRSYDYSLPDAEREWPQRFIPKA